jgi:hypothetical protein
MKYLFVTIALLATLQTAHAQPDAGLVATYSEPEAVSVEEQAPQAIYQQMAELGGADASGGNFVGDELFDDYENKGVTRLKPSEIQNTIKPVSERLEKLVPGFAKKLAEASGGVEWILDPKPLRQEGSCQNQTSLSVQKVVRACQSKIAVRIDQEFYEKSDLIRTNLNTHESLVYLALRSGGKISEEGLREASRAIRNPHTTAAELKATLQKTGFGTFATYAENQQSQARIARAMALCKSFNAVIDITAPHANCKSAESIEYFTENRAYFSDSVKGIRKLNQMIKRDTALGAKMRKLKKMDDFPSIVGSGT